MKKNIILFFCLLLGNFLFVEANAQVNLERYDCFSLKANFEHEQDISSRAQMTFTYSLEKLIAPSVWSEKRKKQGVKSEVTFENLSIGFYRVSYITSEAMKRSPSYDATKKMRQVRMEKRSLVSKIIEVKDCDGKNPISLSTPFQRNQLLIYPNPAKDEVFVQVSKQLILDNTTLQLQDISGRLIKEVNVNSPLETINLSDVLPGLYFVSIKNGDQVFNHQKLLVTKN